MRRRQEWRVVHQVAAWCLGYPDDELLAKLPLLRTALLESRRCEPVERLLGFVDHLARTDPARLRRTYVELFDLKRHQTLYLTYWTDGDTRRRGSALAAIKERYRASGWSMDAAHELPDHLPLMLEYAAIADPVDGLALLQEHRAAVELVRMALEEKESAYAAVLDAVCCTLPGASPKDKAAARALLRTEPPTEPPTETVGLDLLPMPQVREGARS